MSKRSHVRLVSSAFLAVVTAVAASASAREGAPLIVALGDSLTSGRGIGRDAAYPAVLQERLDDEEQHDRRKDQTSFRHRFTSSR